MKLLACKCKRFLITLILYKVIILHSLNIILHSLNTILYSLNTILYSLNNETLKLEALGVDENTHYETHHRDYL